MKRLACAILLLVLGADRASLAAPVQALAFPLPPLAAVERGAYRALDSRTGRELWRVRWSVERTERGGERVIRFGENGSGRRWTPEPATWTVATELTLPGHGNDLRLTSTKQLRDASGRVIDVERRELDYRAGSGFIESTHPETGRTSTSRFTLTPDSIDVAVLPIELRVLPELPGQKMQFHLVTRDGKIYPMMAKVAGRDRVTTPAGTFDCYKIQLTVQGLTGLVAKLLLPPMYMWNTVAAPHFWVKYQGPDGGVGSRTVAMELVSFESQGATAGKGRRIDG